MPNAIDRCGSCGQSVYLEENVEGGCGCPERDFRILLARQRERNNSGKADFASAFMASGPPDISQVDPGLLMSAAGRNEFEAARQLSAFQGISQAAPPAREAAQEVLLNDLQELNNVTAETMDTGDDIDLGGGDDWTGLGSQQPERHMARVASVAQQMDGTDLAAMWMQGTGIPFDRSQLAAPDHLDDFQFDTELAMDTPGPRGGGGGAVGGRFRVDGGPPPRPAFDRGMINAQGPTVEAARVRGRFAVLREAGPREPVGTRPPGVRPVERSEPASPRAPVSAVQQARELQARSRGPSVYERLRDNPFKK
jgi:hypothetical protein